MSCFIFCLLVAPFSRLLISSASVVIAVVKICRFVNLKPGIMAFYLKKKRERPDLSLKKNGSGLSLLRCGSHLASVHTHTIAQLSSVRKIPPNSAAGT